MDTRLQQCPLTNIQQLARNLILQALADTIALDPVRAVDAVLWLTGGDFGLWAEAAGLPFADSVQLLTSGQAFNAAKKARQKRGRAPMFEFTFEKG